MSRPTDPAVPRIPSGDPREFRSRGRMLGFDYDLGVRIMPLFDPELEPPGAPLFPEAPTPDAIGRWESEGGAVA